MHIGVVGAGLAGLSAALHLLGAGHEVTVVERAARPGGRASTVRAADRAGREHDVDPGASVLTMPQLAVDALVAGGLDEARARAELDLLPVTPAYVGRFADGSTLAVPDQLDAPDHMRWQQQMFDAAYERFIAGDAAPLTYANPRDLHRLGRIVRLGALTSMQAQVDRRVLDPRARRMLTFQALYAGVSPRQARAVYAVISHMDVGLGVVYPRRGMGAVAEAMAAQVARRGTVRLGTAVTGLQIVRGRATALDTDTGPLTVDGVVLTPDTPVTDRLLPRRAPRRVRLSPSAVVGHLLVDPDDQAAWPTQAHHTLDFGAAWETTFAEITATRGRGRCMSDPSFLLTRPAVTTGAHAPVSVLAPCPNLESAPIDWAAAGPGYLRHCLATLRRRGYRGIDRGELLRLDTPATWARAGLAGGTPFSAAHTLTQTGPLRRRNRVPGIPNAVLAGSFTHPGVGVPPALISGRLAAQAFPPGRYDPY
ncbi:phytoene desaturase family protein [Tsukamurella sp. 8F]|uniref:phytoene desaturase family protein n=1 Tax=unclassified Tsukamurella TaxID=2633480 RepID=UPI0023B9B1DA|nr:MULTISPECIES: phytoene desaturase family protein [unclassified Tsukamurella]MDF0528532.1 phytoene desaturase family protein [Tsukamurella sp. 8J]MDF0586358.1 phytoene desaturase family protein [Tsukamurella sp. 8F]